MNQAFIIIILIAYFGVLLLISHYTSKNSTSQSFFTGDKKSPWYLVAFGMIGTSLSGVTFVSVPGTVTANGFYYYQMVLGFFIGYFIVAYILLPLYYKYNLSSIYRYLEYRLGFSAYKWGAGYFILSRTLGATVRLYLVINVLQIFVFDSVGIPFWLSTMIIIAMIIAYTFRGGVKTIVWTDTLQTVFMLLALVVCILAIQSELNWSWGHIWNQMSEGGMTKLWSTDPLRKDFMWKHIIGGAFITITMTGLDQEMMQKNISVKNLKDAQKNMVVFSFILLFVNALFLLLGGMLQLFATQHGWEFKPDDLFPSIVQQHLPFGIFIIFIIGLISALFPSVDGAITALTSSFCIDILGFERRSDMDETQKNNLRKGVHFMLLVFYFKWMDNKSIVDLIFTIAGFTYGPLLGLFAFGIMTKRSLKNYMVPIVCLLAPLICLGITYGPLIMTYFDPNYKVENWLNGYAFGHEMLILNGGLTFTLLYFTSTKAEKATA
jgi:SSS family transporter